MWQDAFDSFEDVDDIYQSLPLDKIEALENLEAIPNVAPSIVVKEKVSAPGSCLQQHSEEVKNHNVLGHFLHILFSFRELCHRMCSFLPFSFNFCRLIFFKVP